MIKILLTLIFSLAARLFASEDYGYFDVSIIYLKNCQGPVRKDCAVSTINIINDTMVNFNVDVRESMTPTKGKIIATLKNKQMLRLLLNKPCSHFFINPLFKTILNTTDDCLISKGRYSFDLDLADLFQRYYRGMFLYGNWTFKSMFFDEECNLFHTTLQINIHPRKTN